MFGRDGGTKTRVADTAAAVKGAVSDAADAVVEYVDPLARDKKLREELGAAILAGEAARRRMRMQTGLSGLARRLATDPVLRTQLVEAAVALQTAKKRAKRTQSHRLRNTLVFLTGAGVAVAAVPALRDKALALVRGDRRTTEPATVEEEVEVAVPVSTAYNQWTQFEEFPRFMAGVDQVRQLDETLLHWAVTVAGRHAEWDARIIEQEPDRRIAWESTDGKRTRGTVSFEAAGPDRSRVQLRMSYTPEGASEKVGSAIGLDRRRIRGDLQRFRELIESRRAETGAWRGEVEGGVTRAADDAELP